jgi:hypothetical protein
VLRAWRDAADPGEAEDSEIAWHDTQGARWRVVTTTDPDRTLAAALWLNGAPAPDGLALRLRLARDSLGSGGNRLVLAEISAASANGATAAAVARLIAAQAGFPGSGP